MNKGKELKFINQGVALSELGKFNKAILFHDIAISLDPRLAEAYANKGINSI